MTAGIAPLRDRSRMPHSPATLPADPAHLRLSLSTIHARRTGAVNAPDRVRRFPEDAPCRISRCVEKKNRT